MILLIRLYNVAMKELIKKYKSIISYLFFGVCTTLVNIVVYYLCAHSVGMTTVISTVIAWIASVLFAFITNKLYVFESKSFEKKLLLREGISFFGCRLATGILDLVIMYISVDLLDMQDLFMKILSNVLVIVLNYICSKLVIFKKA